MIDPNSSSIDIGRLRSNWGWFLLLGTILILVGAAAVAHPMYAGLAVMKVIAFLLIFSGATEVVFAAQMRRWGGVALNILAGVLEIIVGAIILRKPDNALVVLTLVFIAYFLVGGIFRIVAAFTLRVPGAVWLGLSGLVTTILGVMLYVEWPATSEWLIGTLVGIDMIFNGISWNVLAFSLRSKGTPDKGTPNLA